jgi:hypothetical protein
MDSGHSLATLQNAWKLPARKNFSKIRSANKSRSANLPFITFLRELIYYISLHNKKTSLPNDSQKDRALNPNPGGNGKDFTAKT